MAWISTVPWGFVLSRADSGALQGLPWGTCAVGTG